MSTVTHRNSETAISLVFQTVDKDTGILTSVTGGALGIRKNGDAVSALPITGVTAGINFETGTHKLDIDASANTSFFSNDSDFRAVWTAGTVAGNSIANHATGSVLEIRNPQAHADQALVDIHLDHLLAVDYDPASKPGVATALLNELIENSAGVSRFTQASLVAVTTDGNPIVNLIYRCFVDVEFGTTDRYTVVFTKSASNTDGVAMTAGVVTPQIESVRRNDGTTAFTAQTLTAVGSQGAYKYDASNLVNVNDAAIVTVNATLDGNALTFPPVLLSNKGA